ncbi:MAG: CvpA family protein [Chitinophagaceae bacterium]|nr:CvpA family protein [Chitinophagaceae bacterium]
MIIDIIVLIAVALAIIKGLRSGLIVAVFSIIAFVIGLVAALKLSTVVAAWLAESTSISTQWLPFIAFAAVFFLTVFAIRAVAKLIEKAVDLAWLGWANKLGGVAGYAILYLLILSVLFFYAAQMKLFAEETIAESRTYSFIQPLGPTVIDTIGAVVPIFSNMFTQLENFFEKLGTQMKP